MNEQLSFGIGLGRPMSETMSSEDWKEFRDIFGQKMIDKIRQNNMTLRDLMDITAEQLLELGITEEYAVEMMEDLEDKRMSKKDE